MSYIKNHNLQINSILYEFINSLITSLKLIGAYNRTVFSLLLLDNEKVIIKKTKEIKSILHILNFFILNLEKTSIEYKFHSLFLD